MLVSFQLTMPNVASWNGRWSGEGKKYFVIRDIRKKSEEGERIIELLFPSNGSRSFYYRWEDGWGANVTMEIVEHREAARRRKISSGFCAYEWMIDSILKHGAIYASHEAPI